MAFTTLKTANMPALELKCAFGADRFTGSYTDLTTRARDNVKIKIVRGRSRELDRFQTGTMTVQLDNRDGALNPENTGSPYSPYVIPLRRMSFRAQWNAVAYNLFLGFGDGFPQSYTAPRDAVSTVTARDLNVLLASSKIPQSWYELIVSTDNPTHWWHFDNAVNSQIVDSGNATNLLPGNVIGGVELGATGIIPFDAGRTCAQFDGSSAVTFGGALGSSTTWSVETWIDSAAFDGTTTAQLILASGWSLGKHAGFFLAMGDGVGDIGNLEWSVLDDAGNGAYVNPVDSSGGVHHVVLTRDTSTCTMYIDGASAGTFSLAAAHGLGSQLVVGAPDDLSLSPTFRHWTGTLQEVAYYDGVVLSPTQVLAHYNAGMTGMAGNDSGTVAQRVLDSVGISSSYYSIQTGSSLIGSYDLSGGTAAAFLDKLADTEQGMNYTDGAGVYTWRSRSDLVLATRSKTSQATFGDSGSELKYSDIGFDHGTSKLFTTASVTRDGGVEQTAANAAGVALYGEGLTYEKAGLVCSDDSAALSHAQWAADRFGASHSRIEWLEIRPRRDPTNLFPQALGREIGDRITVKRRPPSGETISVDVIIEGIEHTISNAEWITVFRCSPAEARSYWVFDDAVLSIWDNTTRMAF